MAAIKDPSDVCATLLYLLIAMCVAVSVISTIVGYNSSDDSLKRRDRK